MDLDRFDDLSRTVTRLPSRRGVLGGLAALFASIPLALSGTEAEARKKRKNKNKKKRGKDGKRRDPDIDKKPACTPRCDGRTCGNDGCGETCGTCAENELCDDGNCVCVPECAPANACGDDGCGRSCGTCGGPICEGITLTTQQCNGGTCTPVVTNCDAGQVCFLNACCTKDAPSTCRRQAEPDGCGGNFLPNCGINQFCCEGPGGGDPICQDTACL